MNPSTPSAGLRLVDITPDNWRCDLHVSERQQTYVANRTVLLARAYAYKEQRSRAFFVCDGDTPIGMGLYYDLTEMDCYDFSQFFIDERYQGRGYGRAATRLILDELRRDGKYKKVTLCYIEGNTAAETLYRSFGFRETDRDGDEIGMEMAL